MVVNNKVSIKQIAESIPCSSSTVSIVLNGNGDKYRISKQTQAVIISAAKRLGYFSNTVDLHSKENSKKLKIGLFVCLDDSSPINDMLSGISDTPEYGDKLIEYCLYPFFPSELISMKKLLLDNDFDGMIILPFTKEECTFIQNLSFCKPHVIISKNIPGMNCIVPDRIACGAAVAQLFITKGYSRIGLVTRNTLSDSGKMRTFGFTSTFEKLGPKNAELIIVDDNSDDDRGFSCMNQLFEKTSGMKLDAIFVTEPNDFSGVVNSMRLNGKIPPRDFDLVIFGSYADNALNQCLSPSITTIGFPIRRMMRDGIDLLCHQIEGGILNGITKVHSPEFCFRESCLKPENWDSIT